MKNNFILRNWKKNGSNFTRFIQGTGQYLSDFLSKVEKVKVEDSTLVLYLESEFLKVWSSNEENKKRLKNIIEFYVHTPNDFELELKSESIRKPDYEKVLRRFSDLTK